MAQGTILTAEFLYGMHPWSFGLVFFVLMVVAAEAGFRLGRKSGARREEETKVRISAVEAGVLGVLGLLLGFTLVMAVSRFDTRRQLVLEEANAIGTSFWRSQLVPPPEGPELAGLLREYVDAKLHYFDAGVDPALLGPSRERIARLQEELWSRAASFARKDSRSVPAGLLLQSLNQTFDLESARWTALVIHVPESVIWVDGFVGLLAVLMVGYTFGVSGRRNPFSMGLLALCIATVLGVIVDLDQPGRGLIQVSQQPLVDLQRQVGAKR
jgi:hypothetical protein